MSTPVPWRTWVARVGKIAFIALSTFFIGTLAIMYLTGTPPMAEPGHWDPPMIKRVAGLATLLGIGALWISILHEPAKLKPRSRAILLFGQLLGFLGALLFLELRDIQEFSAPLAFFIPLLVMFAVELVRLIRGSA